MLDRDRAGRRDADQRVVDAPDGAEQADEGRRAADRGEQHLAELQLRAAPRCSASRRRPRELRVDVAARFERAGAGRRRWQRRSSGAQHLLAVEGGRRCARPAERRARPRTPALRARCRARTRRSSQAFQKITTQALIDISSSSAATLRVIDVALLTRSAAKPLTSASAQARARRPCRTGRAVWPATEARGAQAALRRRWRGSAALVRDLDALAGAGEQHGVVADDVAAADGREADASTGRARR